MFLPMTGVWSIPNADTVHSGEMRGLYVSNILREKSGEITLERMKKWSQSKNNTVVDVTGDGSKV